MNREPYPVILVHGWNSHPGIWNRLIPRLSGASIPFWKFDSTGMNCANISELAAALNVSIGEMREECGYAGPIDIVCHSVGTCITRYLLEVIDGNSQSQKVRHLIGLGPPNNGSALAELFHDPLMGGEIINRLTGIFLRPGFDPATDIIVQDVRPGSPVMQALRSAGIRPDITYHIIVTSNPVGRPEFFPQFHGKTWYLSSDGSWQETFDGDGIVPHSESCLPGISLDILPLGPVDSPQLPYPDQYCHINLPKNPVVVERILQYLTHPVQ
ncbi:MAG: acetyltransferase [Methanoregula sp.]|nr:acetyltransferase [Methanoregula sp.]